MENSFKACRLAAQLSMQVAATGLKVSISTLGRWEKGETSPNAIQVKHMAELYGVSADTLISGETAGK